MKTLVTATALIAAFAAAPSLAQPSLSADQKQRMIEHIMQADANHDGMITRNELIAWRNAEFDRFDRNHDGYIDISDAPRFAAQARARLDEARTAFDLNHDGRISRAEFASGPTPMFDMADLDHNNVLDAYELKQLKKG
jgi:Ca2+-binding EF-hand superfamily protein